MRVIINSCLVTELFANFQTSIDRKSIIGETPFCRRNGKVDARIC